MDWEDIERQYTERSIGTVGKVGIAPSQQAEELRSQLDHGVGGKQD